MGKIKLTEISTRAPKDLEKETIKKKTAAIKNELDELQYLMYAENKHSLLVILQGLDGSGKDGLIRNVFGGLNPQGVSVKSFKVPTEEELSHDFLWRVHEHTPEKGRIMIFNRSHYEDILVTRVNKIIDDKTARKRMRAINDFEELLTVNNSTQILKFYLHISQKEQQERLTERMHNPSKMWKYNEKDHEEAKKWNNYVQVYEECFEKCSVVPWTIVPADQNWYKEFVVASVLHGLLKSLDMHYPRLKKT